MKRTLTAIALALTLACSASSPSFSSSSVAHAPIEFQEAFERVTPIQAVEMESGQWTQCNAQGQCALVTTPPLQRNQTRTVQWQFAAYDTLGVWGAPTMDGFRLWDRYPSPGPFPDRVCVPIAGFYSATAHVQWEVDNRGLREATLYVVSAATGQREFLAEDIEPKRPDVLSTQFATQQAVSAPAVQLDAGDCLQLDVRHTSGNVWLIPTVHSFLVMRH